MLLDKLAAIKAQQDDVVLFEKKEVALSAAEMDFFLSRCHEKQRELINVRSTYKALLCPRRTGKTTYTLFETLIASRRYPGSTIVYVVPDSKGHARTLFWRPLKEMNEKLKLGLTFYETEKRVVTPEGSEILLFGAHDKDAPIQIRGTAYSLAILDECKDFGAHFEELMTEAIVPALEDYGGTLILCGTPGTVLAGVFYNMTKAEQPGWALRIWTKPDNTFLDEDKRDLNKIWQKYYKPFGFSMDSPKFRREQLAEWVADTDERLYQYDPIRNTYNGSLPGGGHEWVYCLGIDLGERDANAFVVGAYALTDRHLYIVDQYSRPGMSIDEIENHIRALEKKYGPFQVMVADTGGYGRGIVTELADRRGLAIEAADKGKNKLGTIAHMNSDFLSGRIRCAAGTPLANEWSKLMRRMDPRTYKVKMDHTDLGDAALYMWKASQVYASANVEPLPLPGTPAWYNMRDQEDFEFAGRAKAERERGNRWN